jgi:hypothetical protein
MTGFFIPPNYHAGKEHTISSQTKAYIYAGPGSPLYKEDIK